MSGHPERGEGALETRPRRLDVSFKRFTLEETMLEKEVSCGYPQVTCPHAAGDKGTYAHLTHPVTIKGSELWGLGTAQ